MYTNTTKQFYFYKFGGSKYFLFIWNSENNKNAPKNYVIPKTSFDFIINFCLYFVWSEEIEPNKNCS